MNKPTLLRTLFFIFHFSFFISSAFSQDPSFCRAMLDSAELELTKRNFNAAREYCEAALPLCSQNTDAIRAMTRRINKAIDAEKRGAENAAFSMKTREGNPTLAMRMMWYNSSRHPESQISHDLYHQTVSDAQAAFMLKRFNGHRSSVSAVAFSPDGKKVLTGSVDNTAKLWDAATGQAEKTFTGHTG